MLPHKTNTRIVTLKAVKVMLILLLAYTVLMGASLIPQGAADVPCQYLYGIYDEQGACFAAREDPPSDYDGASQIETFLTSYQVSYMGGGCYHAKTEADNLDAENYLFQLHLRRISNAVEANGSTINVGNEFQVVNVVHSNPWIISRLQFKNYGEIADCNATTTNRRVIIIGRLGTEFSLIKGGIIVLILSGALILTNRTLKQTGQERGGR